jgi:hypothetical protein
MVVARPSHGPIIMVLKMLFFSKIEEAKRDKHNFSTTTLFLAIDLF